VDLLWSGRERTKGPRRSAAPGFLVHAFKRTRLLAATYHNVAARLTLCGITDSQPMARLSQLATCGCTWLPTRHHQIAHSASLRSSLWNGIYGGLCPEFYHDGRAAMDERFSRFQRRERVCQADDAALPAAIRVGAADRNSLSGRITASSSRALLCEAYDKPGAQAGPAVAADRSSRMGGEASSASGSPLWLLVGQSSGAGSTPRITFVSHQTCCFLPATADPANPTCRHPAGRTSSCVGSGRPASA
jgi:hypothetical protein